MKQFFEGLAVTMVIVGIGIGLVAYTMPTKAHASK